MRNFVKLINAISSTTILNGELIFTSREQLRKKTSRVRYGNA
ncbi:hypothetical protein NIES2100_48350 [Calothrix sp. NIES-2100]|nr:hypothetical protein NIES2100_48350 [Calothrix sp. NIES-2100]